MRRRSTIGVLLTVLLGLLALPSIANASHSDHMGRTHVRTLVATLTGDGETTPVATDAAGMARITIDRRKHLLCYELVTTGLDPVAGHIHRGGPGVDGPPKVDLGTFGEPFGSSSAGCTTGVDGRLLRNLVQHPALFYINLHTAGNPGGEIRGQLAED